jgi:hypothetical protein
LGDAAASELIGRRETNGGFAKGGLSQLISVNRRSTLTPRIASPEDVTFA